MIWIIYEYIILPSGVHINLDPYDVDNLDHVAFRGLYDLYGPDHFSCRDLYDFA